MPCEPNVRCSLRFAWALALPLVSVIWSGCSEPAPEAQGSFLQMAWPQKLSEAEMTKQADRYLAAWFGTPHLRSACEAGYRRVRPTFDPATVLTAYRLAPASTREPGFLFLCSERWNDAYLETVVHTVGTNDGYRQEAVAVLVESGSAAAHKFVLDGLSREPEWFVAGATFGIRQSKDSIFAARALRVLLAREGRTPGIDRSTERIRRYAGAVR